MNFQQLDRDHFNALYDRARATLGAIPGVVGAGFGYRHKDGSRTEELAFVVDVVQKKPLHALQPHEVAPTTFEGYPVDVREVPQVKLNCPNLNKYLVLMGGAYITAISSLGAGTQGTLGCFVNLNAVTNPNGFGLLTNQHVLTKYGAVEGDPVLQPGRKLDAGGAAVADHSLTGGPIALIYDTGKQGNHPYLYPDHLGGGVPTEYFVDVATARLKTWFMCKRTMNLGTHFVNAVEGLNINGSSAIAGVARVTAADIKDGHYRVYKCGSKTGRTAGIITRVELPVEGEVSGVNTIEIAFESAECAGVNTFSDFGDSGSVIVNENREVVGLLFGSNQATPAMSFACHIHPCLNVVKSFIISESSYPRASLPILLNGPAQPLDPALLLGLLCAGMDDPAAAAHTLDQHQDELMRLLNDNHAVRTAWQRGRGPSYLGHFIRRLQDPGYTLPEAIHGITYTQCTQLLLEALRQEASRELRAAVHALHPTPQPTPP